MHCLGSFLLQDCAFKPYVFAFGGQNNEFSVNMLAIEVMCLELDV